jgi:hypothetical protein
MKDIILAKDGLIIQKDTKGITVEYTGDLTLNLKGSMNLIINGAVNLLGNGPINIDAPKTDDTNYPITLNSRCNEGICNLPSSISFRKKAELKAKKAYKQVNYLLLQDGIDVEKVVKIARETEGG